MDLERDLEEYEKEQQINAQYVEEFAMLTSEKVCLVLKRFDRPEKFETSGVSLLTGQNVRNDARVTYTY